MPGNINYKISFDGIDTNLVKLREMVSLLSRINTLGGSALSGLVGSKGGGSTNFIPLGGAAAGAGTSETVAAASAGAAIGSSISGKSKFNVREELNKASDELRSSLEALQRATARGISLNAEQLARYTENIQKAQKGVFNELSGPWERFNFGTPPPRTPNRPYSSPIGPIGPYNSPAGPFLSQFSNWTKFSANFSGNVGGGIGGLIGNFGGGLAKGTLAGGLGASLGAGIAGLLGYITPLTIAFAALTTTVIGLKTGIQSGAQVYREGARYGYSVGTVANSLQAFRQLGIDNPDLSILQGQFRNRNGRVANVPDSDIILGAARAGQLGNQQQLLNLADDFRAAMKDGAASARQMANAARSNFESSNRISAIGREWHTLWAQIAALSYPFIQAWTEVGKAVLKTFNLILEAMVKFLQFALVLPKGQNFSQILGGKSNNPSNLSAWERIGLVFNGANPESNLVAIRNNTKDTVKAMDKLTYALQLALHGTLSGFGFPPNLPLLP